MLSLLWDKTTLGIKSLTLEDLNIKLDNLFAFYLTAEKNQTRLHNMKVKMSKTFLQTMVPKLHADVEKKWKHRKNTPQNSNEMSLGEVAQVSTTDVKESINLKHCFVLILSCYISIE